MAVTIDDIEAFHRFALGRVSESHDEELTLDDLFIEWDSQVNRENINHEIRAGIADVDAGRARPVNVYNQALRSKYSLGK